MAKDRVERDDEDLVRLYLTDIGQYTLLTKDDEVRLAKAIEAGKEAIESLDVGGKDVTPPASASCAAPPARVRRPSASSCSRTSASSCRSPRSTRHPGCRCSTSSRRATSA